MIKLLDCTLRDGGYNNNWEFGSNQISKIYNGLIESKVDIIECGFITQKVEYSEDISQFDSIERVTEKFKPAHHDCMSVCMINYGHFKLEDIPERKKSDIDGIRVAFHKKDITPALKYCEGISSKGYKVFMQPMVSMTYTDEEFLELINLSNKIRPYAFYIVDSFGVMRKEDLMRFFYLVDNNLDESISIGFHSHNNLQLSYSNAQALVDLHSLREIIIDSSIMGMGRGAGNLNTELFVQYLNDKLNKNYESTPLLKIVDEILTPIHHHNFWGYSLPHYLSASHNCHPNYATYLDNKNTLTVSDINNILTLIPDDKKVGYSKEYTEELYIRYQTEKEVNETSYSYLKSTFKGKNVLIIAPGNSIKEEENAIKDFINDNDLLSISVNFKPRNLGVEYVFVSNRKRYDQLQSLKNGNLILTSNIASVSKDNIVVNYKDLLNQNTPVSDNSGLMLVRLLINLGVSNVYLAGFDGYSQSVYDNYSRKDMAFIKDESIMASMNKGLSAVLSEYNKVVNIKFLTKEHYVKIQ